MIRQEITFSEAIEKVMLTNGYLATFKHIYKEFPKYRSLTGKTPFKTIQERVQRDQRFTRVGVGVYALTEFLHELPKTNFNTQEFKECYWRLENYKIMKHIRQIRRKYLMERSLD